MCSKKYQTFLLLSLKKDTSIILPHQTAYVKNLNIIEEGRLISDISKVCSKQKINGYFF